MCIKTIWSGYSYTSLLQKKSMIVLNICLCWKLISALLTVSKFKFRYLYWYRIVYNGKLNNFEVKFRHRIFILFNYKL